MHRSPRRHRGEDGIFLVLWALLVVGLLVMVAIVLDLGALRSDRRTSRSAADAAALAGSADLFVGAEVACNSAWTYAIRNLGFDSAAGLSAPNCAGFATLAACDNTAPVMHSESGTAGEYTITISSPVPNLDPLLDADAVGPNIDQPEVTSDGDPCDRLAVRITRTRQPIFARVVDDSTKRTSAHSVGLELSGTTGVPASLVVLDPTRCSALSSSGEGGVEVTGTSATLVGAILVVSDGTHASCTSPPPYVLDVQGGNTGSHVTVTQPGDIYIGALAPSGCAAPACDASQLNATTGYFPKPKATTPVPDRSLVEDRFNCRSNYATTGPDPNYRISHQRGTSGAVLPACDAVASPAKDYVNEMFRAVRSGALEPLSPTVVPNATITSCNALTGTLPAGNYRVTCAMPNGFILSVNGNIWFDNTSTLNPGNLVIDGNAVFGGPVTVGNNNVVEVRGNAEFRLGDVTVSGAGGGGGGGGGVGGTFTVRGNDTACDEVTFIATPITCVRQASATSSFVYLGRNVDSFNLNGGVVTLDRAAVFAEGGIQGGTAAELVDGPVLNIGGGATVNWLSPTTGPFASLLAWSDKVTNYQTNATVSSTGHNLAGGGSVTLNGIFFSPTAAVNFTGNSDILPVRAQFWANTLHQSGNGRFRMTPDGSFIPVPVAEGSRLIR